MENINLIDKMISGQKRDQCIKDIINFFQDERDEKIGIIAAEKILVHFISILGNDLYNKGVEDAKNLLEKHMDNLSLDLDSLLKK